MLISARPDGFGFGRDPFVPHGPELDRAGSLTLLAPMPLRAVEPLPHPAIVANENFFSHANLVSTSGRGTCQVLFSPKQPHSDRKQRPGRLARTVLKNCQK